MVFKDYKRIPMYFITDIYIFIPVSFQLHGIKFLSPILETGEQETISYCPGLLFVLGGCVLSVPLSLQEHSIIWCLYIFVAHLLGTIPVARVLSPSSWHPQDLAYSSCSRNIFKMMTCIRGKINILANFPQIAFPLTGTQPMTLRICNLQII